MIAPTMTIPWIAFVPDISGVCRSVGTFEITCTPRKAARIRTVSSIRKLVFTRRCLLPGHARAGGDLVVEVEHELALGREVGEQRLDVAGIELARVVRHLARQVEQADDRHAVARRPPRRAAVSSQLPPVSAARSTITEPGRIASTADAGISFGAGRPGIAAVVITAS